MLLFTTQRTLEQCRVRKAYAMIRVECHFDSISSTCISNGIDFFKVQCVNAIFEVSLAAPASLLILEVQRDSKQNPSYTGGEVK